MAQPPQLRGSSLQHSDVFKRPVWQTEK
jgi:hypothetical protein